MSASISLAALLGATGSVHAADVVKDNIVDISTSGNQQHALEGTTSIAGENVSLTNSGALTTNGLGGQGIRATAASGNVKIESSGDIATKNVGAVGLTMNDNTHAILGMTGGDGNVTIEASGKLETHGVLAAGLRGITTGAGTVDITYSGPSIHVFGDDAEGISAESTGTGNIVVRTQGAGTILADGAGAAGASAFGIAATSGSGNVDVTNAMSIHATGGANSSGILAKSDFGGDVAVESSGVITTTGADSHGIYTITNSGDSNVKVINSGDMTIGGAISHGINIVQRATGNVEVVNSGNLTTTNGNGVFAQANLGAIDVTNRGDITIDGDTQNSISAEGGSGAVTIDNYGAIATKGLNSSGITATGIGDITVNHRSGASIETFGDTIGSIAPGFASVGILVKEADVTATGNVLVNVDGDITTHASNRGVGAFAETYGTGNSTINATGNIETMGASIANYGLAVRAHGGGDASIFYTNAAGHISTAGTNSHAIYADTGAEAGSVGGGDIRLENAGTLTTSGDGAAGIYANSYKGAGSVAIVNTGAITTNGLGGQGIHAQSLSGDARVIASGDITTHDGSVLNSGDVRSHGIFAVTGGPADKVARIEYTGGNVTVNASGDTDYDMVAALRADTSGGADALVTVSNAANLAVNGSNTAGIDVRGLNNGATTGNLNVEFLSGTINAGTDASLNSDGIHAINYGRGSVDVTSLGNITVKGNANAGGDGSEAIYANAAGDGHVTVKAGGTIQVLSANANESAGIVAVTRGAGNSSVTFDDAAGGVFTVADGAAAIKVAALGSGDVSANVNAGQISTLGQADAMEVISAHGQTVTVGARGELSGGRGGASAIHLQTGNLQSSTPTATVTNAGKIGALSDRAIATNFVDGSTLAISNQAGGEITGFVTLRDGANTLDNAGTWNLRDLSASTGSGVRDTLRVAVADFGAGPSNTIDNSGTLALLGGAAANVDATGLYNTGHAANALASNGAVQGHILGVSRFTNSGLIDLGGNAAVGNVLLISGGRTAGVSGGGTFVSNGGTLKINTVLNEGGANSQSDMLVVDRTRLGKAATGIKVNNVGGAGAVTQGNGIEVVRVLEGAQSADGAFALDGRAVAGAHEYLLHKGSDADATNGNWYLRNTMPTKPVEPPGPTEPSDPTTKPDANDGTAKVEDAAVPGGAATPLYRPEAGAYLGNQYAASGMFAHTLHDRLGEVNFAERGHADNDKPTAGWARLQGRKMDSEAAGNQLDMSTNSWVLQGGFELGRWNSGDNRFHAGLMFGTGSATTDVRSNLTGYKATGKVDGNSVGVYGTWYADASKPTGLYVDTWLQYGRYDNEVQGQFLAREAYKSSTRAGSIEAGYAFELSNDDKRAIYIEPQVQAIYTNYSADNHIEANGTVVRAAEAGGLTTRVGARLYGHEIGKEKKFQPFVEANWWHADKANAVSMNFERVEQNLPRDRFELKVGAEAELGGGWTGWGHVGLQKGSNYQDVAGQVGVKYTW